MFSFGFSSTKNCHLGAPLELYMDPSQPVFGFLKEAVQRKASDIFLSVGEPVTIKVYGKFERLTSYPIRKEVLEQFIESILPKDRLTHFHSGYDVDLGIGIKDVSRFRLNIFRHYKGFSLAARPLPVEIPHLENLGLSKAFCDLTRLKRGLILVTGPAGSGKTTTLASFINKINLNEERHIISIEDPIEYLIPNERSLVHQREIATHTSSFSEGLKSALRENPDVIVVGELRDLDSISLALRAAETGHLVLATLHSGSAVQSLTRLLDVFDSIRQLQIRAQLAQSLQCVCSQRLIRRIDRSGMILATEVLMITLAITYAIGRNLETVLHKSN